MGIQAIERLNWQITVLIMDKKEFIENFSARLKDLRTAHAMTQQELAEISGLTANWISHFEAGRRLPTLFVFSKLVNALGGNSDYFLKQ